MKKKQFPTLELLILAIGEIIVSLLVILGYLISAMVFEGAEFSYKVITGVALGSLVTIANYLFLNISVNRAVNRFLDLRGDAEMDDEAAAKFAEQNSAPIQNAIRTSFILRTLSMLATLVVAFVFDCFAPLATVIPLLCFRPIITLGEILRVRAAKKEIMPLAGMLAVLSGDGEDSEAECLEDKSPKQKESDD